MKVILFNLPNTAHQKELDEFLGKFRKSCGTVHVVDKEIKDAGWIRYAWTDFASDKLASKAVKRLTGHCIHDRQVFLREMVDRHVGNERRAPNHGDDDMACDKRRSDRRTYGNTAVRYTHAMDRAPLDEASPTGIIVDEIDEAELFKILYGQS